MTLVAEPSLRDLFRDARRATAKRRPVAQIDHTAYQTDPIGWARDVLGVPEHYLRWSLNPGYDAHGWDGTPDPLCVAAEAIARGQWVAVSSGTGTGKTFLVAILFLWHKACFRDSITVTAATTAKQQEKGVWRYIGDLWPAFSKHFPAAELTSLRIRMEPWRKDSWSGWAITAAVEAGAQSNTAVQGLHGDHVLMLLDEMPGIEPQIVTAFTNTATGDRNIIAGWGNPDFKYDPLGVFGMLPQVVTVRISALDHPNVVLGRELIPGAVTRQSIQLRADQYTVDGPLYDSRVRGLAPEQSEHALIKLAWCEAAATRAESLTEGLALRKGPRALGVDVAQSENGDKAAIAAGVGAVCLTVRSFPCNNATQLGRDVWRQMQQDRVQPVHVGVDPIGVGAATVNALDELADEAGLGRVVRCNAGTKPMPGNARAADGSVMDWIADANRFRNLRAQMWWQLREDLRNGVIGLPRDLTLFAQLTAVQFDEDKGVVTIESKDDIRKRMNGQSPDEADALVMWNWVRGRTREAEPVPVGEDIARSRLSYGRNRHEAPAPWTTPRVTGWRPVAA